MFWLQQKNTSNIHDLRRISPATQLCEECRAFSGEQSRALTEQEGSRTGIQYFVGE